MTQIVDDNVVGFGLVGICGVVETGVGESAGG